MNKYIESTNPSKLMGGFFVSSHLRGDLNDREYSYKKYDI